MTDDKKEKLYDNEGSELLFCARIYNSYIDKDAKVIDGVVYLSQKQINDLKYKGECLSTDEQDEILKKYDGMKNGNIFLM